MFGAEATLMKMQILQRILANNCYMMKVFSNFWLDKPRWSNYFLKWLALLDSKC